MSKHPTKLDCWSPFHIVWFLQGWRLLRRTMRLEFLYKLLLGSLPAVVVLRIVPYYLTPCPIFFFPVQKSVVQVLLNVVMRALLHHFSLINVHLWITHLHIWCVGSIGCLRQHRGVGFGARCHRWQGSGAFVPCLCVSSHSKQRGQEGVSYVWYGNYCDVLRLEHVKCYDPDHLPSSFVPSGACLLFPKMRRRTKLKCNAFSGGCCLYWLPYP